MAGRRGGQVGEHDARLHHGGTVDGVEVENAVDVTGHVDDHAADGVASHGRAGAAHHDGCAGTGGEGHRGREVVDVGGDDDQVGYDPVVGGVGGVQRPAAGVMAGGAP